METSVRIIDIYPIFIRNGYLMQFWRLTAEQQEFMIDKWSFRIIGNFGFVTFPPCQSIFSYNNFTI